METLESSRVCRLCGKQSGISINIFDKNENHVKKINAVLPIMVHEMDLLPKHMCHRCSYKLEEFHKFYVDCLKTDADLKSQLSWMRKEDPKERVGIPMVHIENIKIKIEPPDYDAYDMNPMVDNVNYINSMSSVTFQPNDIPYAAYTQCRCCCDKMDQSNQTVPTNYENTAVSKCNRLNDAETETDDRANELQAVKKNLLASKTFQEQSNLANRVDENSKNPRRSRPTSSSFHRADDAKCKSTTNEEVSRGAIVRNLRPRKYSVDYVGTKKKLAAISISKSTKSKTPTFQSSFDAARIKVEKFDGFEGRILRPRTVMIDYLEPKRKYSKSTNKNQRSQGDKYRAGMHKVRNIANKVKLPSRKIPKLVEDRIKFAVKQEQLSDLEDTVLNESILSVTLPKNRETSSADDLADKVDALPNDRLVNVQNDRINCNMLSCAQHDVDFSVANKLKSLTSTSKSKLKSEKVGFNRIAAISYSPKYLRSQDFYLRNGKIRKLDNAEISARKLRRNLRSITDAGKSTGRSLMRAIKGIVSTKKISASIKLIDNNIKHYCEECNMSFINKELFKLHACYH